MATGQVLFQRFFYTKSFVKHSMEVRGSAWASFPQRCVGGNRPGCLARVLMGPSSCLSQQSAAPRACWEPLVLAGWALSLHLLSALGAVGGRGRRNKPVWFVAMLTFQHVSMACVHLASKIEEAPRRIRDVMNVFHRLRQLREKK